MTQQRFQLTEELKIVPGVAIGLAAAVFVGAQVFWHVVIAHQHDAPPVPLRIFLGFMTGAIIAVIFLMCGYVYRDAKRRGMNALLWLLLVIFIPNALGFIVYFLVRHPLTEKCPRCGAAVSAGFNFCPKCNYALAPVCPNCRRSISTGDLYCPYCGTQVAAAV